ncbi:MAG TPA: fibronectin type III domain-containing protein [Ilumatobacteraceae bacterium]|nr:fibronectin type III domain-containing protein [Ilumatobacteraceae bacterium]
MIRRLVLATTVVVGALAVTPAEAAPARPTRLPSPSAVVAVAGSHSATVSWRRLTSVAGVKGYVVQGIDSQSRVVKVGFVTAPTRTITIGDLTPGSTLRFRVAAFYSWTRWLAVRHFSSPSAPITVPLDPQSCSGSVTASMTGAVGVPAEARRSEDIGLEASLSTDCTGDWTYAWSYRRGSAPASPVPSGWTGSATASLTVPKQTLDKYAVTGEDYTFTVTATPPAGTTATATSADVVVRVTSTAPLADFLPSSTTLPAGDVNFVANVGTLTTDPDYAIGDEHLTFHWTAIDLNVAEDTPAVIGGSATSASVVFQLLALRSYEVSLTVCRSDDPTTACVTVKHTTDIADQGA